jgi:hypothetical protein
MAMVIDLDIQVLQQSKLVAPGSGSLLVSALKDFGLSVWSGVELSRTRLVGNFSAL